MGTGTTDFIFS